jgi:predicted GNAT family N-acyltransferase
MYTEYMQHRLVWLDSMDENHLDLRFRVLRVGMPRGSEHYPDVDDDIRTKFLCAFVGQKMVGCSTLQVDARKGCKYRIRGMAVDSSFRNLGIGSDIVKSLQDEAKKENTGIWCNARIRAVPMYSRCGFKIVSDIFEIEDIGPHYDMEWSSE